MGKDFGKIIEKIRDLGEGLLLDDMVRKLEDIHLSLIEVRRGARSLGRQDLIDEINEMERKVMLLRDMLEDERMAKTGDIEERRVKKEKSINRKR